MIELLLQPEVQQFIKDHENHDPFSLSLKHKEIGGIPIKWVAEQIASRKRAKNKLPEWYNTKDLIFPPQISMEQCSSEATAKYKANLVKGSIMYDFTGGYGIDCYYLSKHFKRSAYLEQQAHLCELATHNFKALAANIEVINAESTSYVSEIETADLIYIDPARRDNNSQKVVLLQDCEPDVTTLLTQLKGKSKEVLIKTSPMLDIQLALQSLNHVKAVHVVSVNNECKEVLYHIDFTADHKTEIVTVNLQKKDDQTFSFFPNEEVEAQAPLSDTKQFLYEPNSSVLKAGAFNTVATHYGAYKLHPNTHLYTSEELIENFPGRKFRVEHLVPYNKKKILSALEGKKANITTRNFPEEVKNIRKKTGITDGGDQYIFAFTDKNNQKMAAITRKA
ncbi:hypothetical protein LVD15_07125 [Fulvivirga maritima]|uniref:THUMP-like domain-containing protein n=1 Tax=Fulvivirga maritima TaxID=2904247 RepID=UPI001F322215|nr:hypothetical protein [Fulvivirga maritima]UII28189.1 hypothetical protein LVD15_07125 [Fulvivirga maritima]